MQQATSHALSDHYPAQRADNCLSEFYKEFVVQGTLPLLSSVALVEVCRAKEPQYAPATAFLCRISCACAHAI